MVLRESRTMIERTETCFGIKPEWLVGDTAYGSAPNLEWLVNEQKIAPYIKDCSPISTVSQPQLNALNAQITNATKEADGVRASIKHAAQARQLLAIAAVLDGASRTEAAEISGMDRQTLPDWVIRFNDQGPDGLINIPSPGVPPKLDASRCRRNT
jgi:Helix-turn-helix domain